MLNQGFLFRILADRDLLVDGMGIERIED